MAKSKDVDYPELHTDNDAWFVICTVDRGCRTTEGGGQDRGTMSLFLPGTHLDPSLRFAGLCV